MMKSLLRHWISTLFTAFSRTPFSETAGQASVAELRALSLSLIEDLPQSRRAPLDQIIQDARQPASFRNLRDAIYGTISLSFGERVARERIARLDARLN